MHHKRGQPKNARAGCLMCKPHKANGVDRRTVQERRQPDLSRLIADYFHEYTGFGPTTWPHDWDWDDGWNDWAGPENIEAANVIETEPGRFRLGEEEWPL